MEVSDVLGVPGAEVWEFWRHSDHWDFSPDRSALTETHQCEDSEDSSANHGQSLWDPGLAMKVMK